MFPRRNKYESRHDVQWLVVGVGNPGREYEGSPHNAGFEVARRLAERHRIPLLNKHQGMYGVGPIDDTDVALLMPLTYMNLSGQSVKPALKQLGLTPQQLVVVHDEADLAFDDVRVKQGGGLAGHNGLKSVAQSLGTHDFARVRIGVGRPEPGDRRPLADWLLAPFDTVLDTDSLYEHGAAVVEHIVQRGLRSALKASGAAS